MFSQNAIREMLYKGQQQYFLESHVHEIVWDSLGEFHYLNTKLHDFYLENQDIHNEDYQNVYSAVFKESLCGQGIVNEALVPDACPIFLSESANYVNLIQ